MSKFTGVGSKALRYYERIGILLPTFTDPDSGYRYYSFNQIYLIQIIQICIELDIPLNTLTQFIDANQTIDYSALLAYGKEVAQKKLEAIERGLKFITDAEQEIALIEGHRNYAEIYSREIPEKYVYAVPCIESFDNADLVEVTKSFFDLEFEDNFDEFLLEFGFMGEHLPTGVKRYMFIELPVAERLYEKAKANLKVIPAGKYFCTQSDTSQIENASVIFAEHLKGAASYLAIESDVFASMYDVRKPINELKIIALI